MTSVYYKYAIAAIIGTIFVVKIHLCEVFDVSRPATFDTVLKVKNSYTRTLTIIPVASRREQQR